MPLKDIGNGFLIADYSDQNQNSQLLNLVLQQRQAQAEAPLNELKAQSALLDNEKKQLDVIKQRSELGMTTLKMALSNDEKGATEGWQALGHADEFIRRPADPKLRAQNIVEIHNAVTGEVRQTHPFFETQIAKDIDTRADIAKKLRDRTFQLEDEVRKTAQTLVQNGMEDYGQAKKMARSIVMDGVNQLGDPQQYAGMSQAGIRDKIHNDTEVRIMAGQSQPPPSSSGENPAQYLKTRGKVSDAVISQVSASKQYSHVMMNTILPGIIQVQKKLPFGTNLGSYSWQGITKYIGQDNPLYRYIDTASGQLMFDQIKADSGQAFPEAEYKRRSALMGRTSDTLEQFFSKTMGQISVDAANVITLLSAQHAAGNDTTALRAHFNDIARGAGDMTPEGLEDRIAAAIVSNIPTNMSNNVTYVNNILKPLPSNTKVAVSRALRMAGKASGASLAAEANALIGR